MADIRLQVDEVKLCIKDAQLTLPGVRHDRGGYIVDHIDIVLPWEFQHTLSTLANLDGIDYRLLNGEVE
jgi:hypothetical protein